jgi:hypothetical protein
MLDRRHGDGDSEVGLAAPRLAGEDEVPSRSHEVRGQIRCDEVAPNAALGCEGEVVDRLEEEEAGGTDQPLDAGLIAIEDFADDEVARNYRCPS